MKEYEGVLLVNPELDEEGVNKVKGVVEGVITSEGGKIENWERWGRRRLAYKIKGKIEAIYILLTFKGGEKTAGELRKTCGLTENILRCMFLKRS
jgi:small subunit ribosomal protein S6